ncbi:MAG: Trk system potassium transporter TrkA [Alphaproteobacteria bacterium]
MKVVVCGAGVVGSNIAARLASENIDVVVVDQSADLVRRVTDQHDVQGITGHASHPDVLEQAGAGDADMLIAVTQIDEVNMIACQVAHSLFNVPMKIARVREQSYQRPEWSALFSREHMPIDIIISPETEVANAVARRLHVPGAFDTVSLAEDRVRLVGVRCSEDCPIVQTPLRQLTSLFPDLNIRIVAIQRSETVIVPHADDHMEVGDGVYFVVDTDHIVRAMAAFGHEEPEAHRIVIIGGGNIGLGVARQIERDDPLSSVRLIERDRERAVSVAAQVERTMVIHGDALDTEILEEARVSAAETIVAVTADDEVNILSSLLAKRAGARRCITLINKTTYGPLVGPLGIDVVVSPRALTVSTILQHVRRGRIRMLYSILDGAGEIIEADALETSRMVGVPLRDARLPSGVIIGALIRAGDVIIPRGDTIIRVHDRVVLFAIAASVKKVERVFSVRLDFF